MDTIAATSKAFVDDFRDFASTLQQDCKDLRQMVMQKASFSYNAESFSRSLRDMQSRTLAASAAVQELANRTVESGSVRSHVDRYQAELDKVDCDIKQLEERLEQFGYTKAPAKVEIIARSSDYTSQGAASTQQDVSLDEHAANLLGTESLQANLRTITLLAPEDLHPEPHFSSRSPEKLHLSDLGLSSSTLAAIAAASNGAESSTNSSEPGPSISQNSNSSQHSNLSVQPQHDDPFSDDFPKMPQLSSSLGGSHAPAASGGVAPKLETDPTQVATRERRSGSKKPKRRSSDDSLLPLLESITSEEFAGLPSYLVAQATSDDLNGAIEKINGLQADKRFGLMDSIAPQSSAKGKDIVTADEMKSLGLGSQEKALLLLLVKLGRLSLAPGGYRIQSS